MGVRNVEQCLLLKPPVPQGKAGAELRLRQREDLDIVVRAAQQCGIIFTPEHGLPVDDVNDELICRVHEAQIVVIDANMYELSGQYRISPFLYYLMAVRHAITNDTILITRSLDHLPHALQGRHTLIVSSEASANSNSVLDFIKRFNEHVDAIREHKNTAAGNPVQKFIKAFASEQETLKLKLELESLRRRPHEPIQFRRVEPK